MSRHLAFAFALPALLAAVPASGQTRVSNDREMAFKPGESLQYAISYGPVPAGSMELRVVELAPFDGRTAYHFASEVESNRAVSYVFEIESREEAWLDADRLHSLKYRRDAMENDKPRDREYTFDQQRQVRVDASGEVKPTSANAVDQLSMIYYLRLLPYDQGSRFTLRNQADPGDNPLTVRVLKRERIKVPAGTFDTWVLELGLQTDSGVFKKGGDNRLWLTTDARHLPVKISSKIGLGNFAAELVRYEPGTATAAR
ncbi:MAG: DUF3108 domain-containing protein [Gemmatimonadota bacterium]